LCKQHGQYDQIAARIAAAVKLNCGQKAVLLAHSMAGNVMLHMLRLPRFKQWRCGQMRGAQCALHAAIAVASLQALDSTCFVNIACVVQLLSSIGGSALLLVVYGQAEVASVSFQRR
jgi:predicted alpha/beta hydrolase family esterase